MRLIIKCCGLLLLSSHPLCANALDMEATDDDTLTFQGNVYRGNIGQLSPSVSVSARPALTGDLRVRVDGGNVLGRWKHAIDENSDLQFRVYYDRTQRDDPSFLDDLDTIDLDLQHRFALTQRQEIIWGLNYRYTDNRNRGKGIFALEPADSQDNVVSAFVQDQIAIAESLRLTLGTKLEENDFSGFEVQPSARMAWDLFPGHAAWGAVSRAVRVPTRLERDTAIDATNPAGNPVIRLLGNEDFESEELLAYELGYRWQVLPALSVDLAGFYNDYEGLASLERGTAFIDPVTGRTIIPFVNRNLTDGRTQGMEALVTFSPLVNWRLSASYAYLDMELDPRGQDLNRGRFREGSTPRHQLGLRSFLDLPAGLQLDAQFRHLTAVRQIPEIISGEGIPGYSELDLRVAWHGWEQVEIAIVGQNLLHDHHAEFGSPAGRGETERSVYGKVTWGF